ncbi:hypothetical protein VE03_03989 [Pseudogymnoascus sp. 23342-1-I1]|nr:hypothetical protein VE03_03989 [Pseudogymnoascus sp. 23342-1-I1]
MLYSTLSSLLFVALTSAAAIAPVSEKTQVKRAPYAGCYSTSHNPDWMKKDMFSSGIDTVCGQLRGQSINPGGILQISVGGLFLENGRAAYFVGSVRNTGDFAYSVDYDYCRQRMAIIRDTCHGDHDDTNGGEWHDTIYVTADTNAA